MKIHRLFFFAGILFAGTALAEGVSVNPGKWEMTMTMQMSMMPAPQTKTTTECIEKDELGPAEFHMEEDSPCDFSDVVVDDDTVSWNVNCPGPAGGDMKGEWSFTSLGDTITGSGSMSAEMAGQTMDFNMEWDGKRVGECDG